MLRKYILLFLMSSAVAMNLFRIPHAGGAEKLTGKLKIVIEGLRSDNGKVRIGLFNTPETYLAKSNSFRNDALNIKDGKIVWVVEGVPYGDYAVIAHHDKNGNKKMDYMFLKIPKEPFAFSNNVRAKLSQPEWEEVKFKVGRKKKTIRISMD